jgi:hypothetical protein
MRADGGGRGRVVTATTAGVILAVAIPVLVVAATAVAAKSPVTPADTAVARGAVLRRSDLGRGWTGQAAPVHVPPLTCPQFSPSLRGVVQTGAAASPTFAEGSSGPFVGSVAYVFKTAAQATAVWRRAVTAKLGRCVAASLKNGSGHGVTFAVTGTQPLALPPIATARRGYRVAGMASSSGEELGVYLDELVLERGRTLVVLSYSSFSAPAPRELELRLARTVARRLTG